MLKLNLEKAEESEIKLPTSKNWINWIIEEEREFQENIYFCFIDYVKAFDCMDHNKLENSSRNGLQDQTTWPASWEICMQVRKQELELDMEHQTGSK